MGARPGRKNMKNKISHYRTPVKNLILGGHWAELGGGVPIAAKAGANASLLVLQKENLGAFRCLASYMNNMVSLDSLTANASFNPYNHSWIRPKTPAEEASNKPSRVKI